MQVGQAFPEEANMKWYGHRVVKKLYRAKRGKFCNYGVREALSDCFS